MAIERPNAALVVRISKDEESIHKLISGWDGGYTWGSEWRINSGITKIELVDGLYMVHGSSGSIYSFHENQYRQTGAMNPAFGLLDQCFDQKLIDEYQILTLREFEELIKTLNAASAEKTS